MKIPIYIYIHFEKCSACCVHAVNNGVINIVSERKDEDDDGSSSDSGVRWQQSNDNVDEKVTKYHFVLHNSAAFVHWHRFIRGARHDVRRHHTRRIDNARYAVSPSATDEAQTIMTTV